MWVKLLIGDNNLNNIAKKNNYKNVHNCIEENKTYKSSRIEHTQQTYLC
jgi:hypothetical protein